MTTEEKDTLRDFFDAAETAQANLGDCYCESGDGDPEDEDWQPCAACRLEQLLPEVEALYRKLEVFT
jgi:hypothetical protein